jgi:hypothetical protein
MPTTFDGLNIPILFFFGFFPKCTLSYNNGISNKEGMSKFVALTHGFGNLDIVKRYVY